MRSWALLPLLLATANSFPGRVVQHSGVNIWDGYL
jgi:hypothetical protein